MYGGRPGSLPSRGVGTSQRALQTMAHRSSLDAVSLHSLETPRAVASEKASKQEKIAVVVSVSSLSTAGGSRLTTAAASLDDASHVCCIPKECQELSLQSSLCIHAVWGRKLRPSNGVAADESEFC